MSPKIELKISKSSDVKKKDLNMPDIYVDI